MATTRRRGRGTRRTESAQRARRSIAQPRRRTAPAEIVSADDVDAIHLASVRVLSDVGIDFLHDGACRMLAAAGCSVDGHRVRFDPDMVSEAIATAPAEFIVHGRSPERHVHVGGDWVAFSSVASAPNYVTLDGERRRGDRDGYRDFLRLAQMLDAIHVIPGYPVEPVDLHPSVRHLEAAYDAHTISDRAFHIYSLGRDRNLDGLEMARIARGVDNETFEREPSLLTVINASSPLRYDEPMLEGIIQMASRNQVSVITPFTLAGAMAPITLAGALVQQNAEALAGLAFSQVVRPRCAGRVRRVHLERRHAVGLAGVRNARVRQGVHRQRPAVPPLRDPLPVLQRQHVERGRRAVGLREHVGAVGCGSAAARTS